MNASIPQKNIDHVYKSYILNKPFLGARKQGPVAIIFILVNFIFGKKKEAKSPPLFEETN
jgi:hypothetical protein